MEKLPSELFKENLLGASSAEPKTKKQARQEKKEERKNPTPTASEIFKKSIEAGSPVISDEVKKNITSKTGSFNPLDVIEPKIVEPKVTVGNFLREVPSATADVAGTILKGVIKAPLNVGMAIGDTLNMIQGKPISDVKNLPFLGKVQSPQRLAVDYTKQGYNALEASVFAGTSFILDALTVASAASSVSKGQNSLSKITDLKGQNKIKTDIKTSNAFNIERTIKEDPAMRQMIFKPDGKTLQPQFAIGRVNDVGLKLDLLKPGLGDVYKAKINIANTTMDDIIRIGIKEASKYQKNYLLKNVFLKGYKDALIQQGRFQAGKAFETAVDKDRKIIDVINVAEDTKNVLGALPSIATEKEVREVFVDSFEEGTVMTLSGFQTGLGSLLGKVGLEQMSNKLLDLSVQNQKLFELLASQGFQIEDGTAFRNALADPRFVAQSLGRSLPNTLAVLGLSYLTGTASRVAVSPGTAFKIAGTTAFGSGAILEGGFAYQDAINNGATKEQAENVSLIVGIANGILEIIPLGQLFKGTSDVVKQKLTKNIVKELLKGIATTAVAEGGTEGLQQIIANAVATTYDEDRNIFEGVPESVVFGALTGALFGGANLFPSATGAALKNLNDKSKERRKAEIKNAIINELAIKDFDEIEKTVSKDVQLTPQDASEVVDVALDEAVTMAEEQASKPEPLMIENFTEKLQKVKPKQETSLKSLKTKNNEILQIGDEIAYTNQGGKVRYGVVTKLLPERIAPVTNKKVAPGITAVFDEPLLFGRSIDVVESDIKKVTLDTEQRKAIENTAKEMNSLFDPNVPIKEYRDAIAAKSKTTDFSKQEPKTKKETVLAAIPAYKSPEGYSKIEMPEMLDIVRELGINPEVKKNTNSSYGYFQHGSNKLRIVLNSKLIKKDPNFAAMVMAHEIGHFIDYIPNKNLRNGNNLIAKVRVLHEYNKEIFGKRTDFFELEATEPYLSPEIYKKLYNKIESRAKTLAALEVDKQATIEEKEAKQKEIFNDLKNNLDKDENAKKYFFEAFKNEAMLRVAKEYKLSVKTVESLKDFYKDIIKKKYHQILSNGYGLVNQEIKDELIKVTQILHPFDPKSASPKYLQYRYSANELYAEAISMLFNSPGLLQNTAPVFYQQLMEFLPLKENVYNAYLSIQNLYQSGREKVIEKRRQKIFADYKLGEEKLKQITLENLLENDQYRKLNWLDLQQGFWSKNAYIYGKSDLLVKQGRISSQDSPKYIFEKLNYIMDTLTAETRPIMKDLQNTLEAGGANWDEFGARLQLKAIVAGVRDNVFNPNGLTVSDAREILRQEKKIYGEAKNEALEKAIRILRKYNGDILRKYPDLHTAQSRLLMDSNPVYGTFKSLNYLHDRVDSKIRETVGTLNPVANVATMTIKKMIAISYAGEFNIAKKAAVSVLDSEEITPAKTVFNGQKRTFVPPRDKNLGLLIYKDQGKSYGFYVPKEVIVATTFNYVSESRLMTLSLKVLSPIIYTSRFFRRLFVGNPGFTLFNFVRDFNRTTKVLTGSYFKSWQYYAKAKEVAKYRGIANKYFSYDLETRKKIDEEFKEVVKVHDLLVKEGVIPGGTALLEPNTDYATEIDRILGNHKPIETDNLLGKAKQVGTNILKKQDEMNAFVEALPKFAGYYYMLDQNKGKPLNKEQLSYIRKNVGSPDYYEKGEFTPLSNNILLFSNAILQSIVSEVNVATNPKYQSTYFFSTIRIALVPKILMLLATWGAFGEELKELMAGISESEKSRYIVVPLGFDKNGKTIYFRYPLDQTSQAVGSIFWSLTGVFRGADANFTSALADIFSVAAGQLPSVHPLIKVTRATAQYLSGQNPYDSFRGRLVISDQAFQASGKEANKQFAGWAVQQLGGSVFISFYYDTIDPQNRSGVEQFTRFPIAMNITGKFLKVSDFGKAEQANVSKRKADMVIARYSLEEKKIRQSYLRKAQKAGRLTTSLKSEFTKEIDNLYSDLKPAEKSDKKQKAIKRLELGVKKGEASPEVESIMNANTNLQKIQIISDYKKRKSPEKFAEILQEIRETDAASSEVVRAAISTD